jgi:hypothetical protein
VLGAQLALSSFFLGVLGLKVRHLDTGSSSGAVEP